MNAGRAIGERSERALRDLVIAAGALDQLHALRFAIIAAKGAAEVLIEDGEVQRNGAIDEINARMFRLFAARGASQRVAPLLQEALLEGGDELIRLALGRLSGSTEEVRSTPERFFEVLSGVSDVAFWSEVWARLSTAAVADLARRTVFTDAEVPGVAILNEAKLLSPFGVEVTRQLQTTIQSLFWRDPLPSGLDVVELEGLFVSRPLMRIDKTRPVFATTSYNIVDSLTNYIELALPDLLVRDAHGGIQSAFRLLVSEPFEVDVILRLQSMGLTAGRVTADGAWKTQGGTLNLGAQTSKQLKGEIDCLAVAREGICFVIECKCLAPPRDESRLKTLLDGLGSDDGSGYLGRVRAKSAWAGSLASQLQVHRPAGPHHGSSIEFWETH
jgi:hypothetical protein